MKKLSIFLMLLLLGCEPTLDNSSTHEEVIDTLSENFYDKKDEFVKILSFYQDNWVPDIKEKFNCLRNDKSEVDFTTTEYYQKSYSDEEKEWYVKSREVCKLQESAKTFYWRKTDSQWHFYTFEMRQAGYFIGYEYIYSENKVADKTICMGDEPKKGTEKGSCNIPLSDGWYIHYTFSPIPKELINNFEPR